MSVLRISWQDARYEVGENGREAWVRPFIVTTNDDGDDERNVANSGGVPRRGDKYFGLVCTDVSIRREREHPRVFRGEASYGTPDTIEWGGEDPSDLQRSLPNYWFEFVSREVPLVRDIHGDPIVNSCGRQYDPPATVLEYDLVFRMERLESGYNPMWAMQYAGAVNEDTIFGGIERGQARCLPIAAKPRLYLGAVWYITSYEIHLREDGWQVPLLDHGFYVRKEAGFEHLAYMPNPELDKRTTDGDRVENEQTILLNGKGYPLPSSADAIYKDWEVHPFKTFATLQLPELNLSWDDAPPEIVNPGIAAIRAPSSSSSTQLEAGEFNLESTRPNFFTVGLGG